MKNPARLALVLVLLTAVIVRISLAMRFAGSPFAGVQGSDMQFYDSWAHYLLAGQWKEYHACYGLPGYPVLLAALYRFTPNGLWTMLRLQDLAVIATAGLIFDLVGRVAAPGRFALPFAFLAALGWDLCVPAQAFSLILMPTVWVVLAYWGCVRFALSRSRAWLLIGGLVGVTATFVATILFALPLLGAAAWRRAGSPLQAGLLLAAGVAAGTAPVWIFNLGFAHEPVFLSAHGGINFYIGNYAGANGYPKIPPELRAGQEELLGDSLTHAEQALHRPLTRAEVSHYWSERAWAEIRPHPWRWVGLLGLKIRAFWNHFVYDDLTIIALLEEDHVLLPGPGFGAIAALGLAGGLLALWQGGAARWVAAAVLLHLAALLSVFITERYRLPAVPGLLVLGAYGLAWVCENAARRWLPATGLLFAGIAAVYLPPAGPALTSMEPYNLALSEMDHPEYAERALAHLEEAQRIAPRDPHLLFALGRYWSRAVGDPDQNAERARGYYQQAIAEMPAYTDAYLNLAILELERLNQPSEAAALLRTATNQRPDDPGAWYLLAYALRANDPAGARAAIEKALALDPGNARFQELRASLPKEEREEDIQDHHRPG